MYQDVETYSVFNYRVFIKIKSSENSATQLVLLVSVLEWWIRLSILHGILFGLDLKV